MARRTSAATQPAPASSACGASPPAAPPAPACWQVRRSSKDSWVGQHQMRVRLRLPAAGLCQANVPALPKALLHVLHCRPAPLRLQAMSCEEGSCTYGPCRAVSRRQRRRQWRQQRRAAAGSSGGVADKGKQQPPSSAGSSPPTGPQNSAGVQGAERVWAQPAQALSGELLESSSRADCTIGARLRAWGKPAALLGSHAAAAWRGTAGTPQAPSLRRCRECLQLCWPLKPTGSD